MRNVPRLAALLALVATYAGTPVLAHAEGDGIWGLNVRVGQTAALEVGTNWINCDDVVIILPQFGPHDLMTNWLYITGRSPGTTLCRVGIRPGRLYRVTVYP